MTRILVIPEQLRSLSTQLQQTTRDLQSVEGRVGSALGGLAWEARQKANVDGQANHARSQARALAGQAEEMGRYLERKAQAFEEADGQGVGEIGQIFGVFTEWVQGAPLWWKFPFQQVNAWWNLGGLLGRSSPIRVLRLPVIGGIMVGGLASLTALSMALSEAMQDFVECLRNWWQGKGWNTDEEIREEAEDKKHVRTENYKKPSKPWGGYKISGGGFPTYGDGTLHNGIDIKPDSYEPGKTYRVHPIGPGRVFKVGQQVKKDKNGKPMKDKNNSPILAGYGNYVVIEHELSDGTKVYTRYAHLANYPNLKKGSLVGNDTELGKMGSTGRSTGAHLHLEVFNKPKPSYDYQGHKPGELVDPKNPKGPTWGQKMQEDWIDPKPVIDGTKGWKFKAPQTT